MEFLVTQTAYFTWKVEADTPEDAQALASQLGYEDAFESYADAVDPTNILEYVED